MSTQSTLATYVENATFTCGSCGFSSRVQLTGVGEGVSTVFNAEGTGLARAKEDAKRDAFETLALIRCPGCQQRSTAAVVRFWAKWTFFLLIFWAVGLVLGALPTLLDINMRDSDKALAMWVTPLLLGVPAMLMFAISAGSRWARRDGGVSWLK